MFGTIHNYAMSIANAVSQPITDGLRANEPMIDREPIWVFDTSTDEGLKAFERAMAMGYIQWQKEIPAKGMLGLKGNHAMIISGGRRIYGVENCFFQYEKWARSNR